MELQNGSVRIPGLRFLLLNSERAKTANHNSRAKENNLKMENPNSYEQEKGLKTENHNSRIKEGRLTTLRVSNEAENGEPQLQKK